MAWDDYNDDVSMAAAYGVPGAPETWPSARRGGLLARVLRKVGPIDGLGALPAARCLADVEFVSPADQIDVAVEYESRDRVLRTARRRLYLRDWFRTPTRVGAVKLEAARRLASRRTVRSVCVSLVSTGEVSMPRLPFPHRDLSTTGAPRDPATMRANLLMAVNTAISPARAAYLRSAFAPPAMPSPPVLDLIGGGASEVAPPEVPGGETTAEPGPEPMPAPPSLWEQAKKPLLIGAAVVGGIAVWKAVSKLFFKSNPRRRRRNASAAGGPQQAILHELQRAHGPVDLTDLARRAAFRGVHFKRIQSAANALAKKGLILMRRPYGGGDVSLELARRSNARRPPNTPSAGKPFRVTPGGGNAAWGLSAGVGRQKFFATLDKAVAYAESQPRGTITFVDVYAPYAWGGSGHWRPATKSYIEGRASRSNKSRRRRRNGGYQIPRLTKREYATLEWLADRGYDGGILAASGVEEEYDDGSVLLAEIPEHAAWEIQQAVEEDPHAFLASSGSHSLNEKLLRFLDSIV